MGNNMVSVILLSRGASEFILDSVQSVLEQGHLLLELIVVTCDNESQAYKNLLSTCRKFQSKSDCSIKIFSMKDASDAELINFGVKKSKGKIISILNADDVYFPSRLSLLIQPILAGRSDLTMSLVRFIDEDSMRIEATDMRVSWYFPQVSTRSKFLSLSSALASSPLHVSRGNLVFSRSLFEKLGGFRSFERTSEYDFIMRACLYTEPFLVSKQLLACRVYSGNCSIHAEPLTSIHRAEIRVILEDYFHEQVQRYRRKIMGNNMAFSPYNWPRHFRHAYKTFGSMFQSESFLSELSLSSNMTAGEQGHSDLTKALEPFVDGAEDAKTALKALTGLHGRSTSEFSHHKDSRVSSIKIFKVQPIIFKGQEIGKALFARAKLKLPYDERLGLLAVFFNRRIIGVLKFTNKSGDQLEFCGFISAENGSMPTLKTTDLSICWLDYFASTHSCRWQEIPRFHRANSKSSRVLKVNKYLPITLSQK